MEPTRLGPYRIVGRLGRGGMGTVYEAVDDKSGTAVAVKVLAAHLADDPALRRRFHAEIETLKGLVHPSIVRLLAYGEEEGQPYFAMELVRGTSLDQRLRGGERFDWRRCVAIGASVARALKVAHDHGVIHRDLKPANLLMTEEGGVKLADFGIARLFGAGGFTAHGSVVGTAEYMAPEQARGESLDHRADLYALGGVLFAMLAGRPPLKGRSIPEILDKLLREPPPRVASLVAGIPPHLDELIDRMLSKDPARRPATALVTGRLLEAIAEDEQAPPSIDRSADGLTGPADGTRAASAAATAEMAASNGGRGPRAGGLDAPLVTRDASRVEDGRAPAASGGPARRPAGGPRPDGDTAATAAYTADPSATAPEVETPLSTRFTTVENLERVKAEQAAREAWRQGLVGAASAALLVSLLLVGGYFLLRNPTADELHARIERAAGGADDLRSAAPLVERFLAVYADDPRADGVRGIARRIALETLDRRARVGRRDGRSPLERDYRLAVEAGEESPATGLALLEAVQALYGLAPAAETGSEASPALPTTTVDDGARLEGMTDPTDAWPALLAGQIERFAALAEAEQTEDRRRVDSALAEADRLAAEAAAEPARAGESLARRRRLLEAVVRLFASRPHAEAGVAEARRLLQVDGHVPPAQPRSESQEPTR